MIIIKKNALGSDGYDVNSVKASQKALASTQKAYSLYFVAA